MTGSREKTKRKFLSRKKKDTIFLFFLLIFPLTQFAVFYVGVNARSLAMAFQSYDIASNSFAFAGLDNFRLLIKNFVSDPRLVQSVTNSMLLYGIGLLVGLPLNLFFAYSIYKKVPAAGFFRVILFLPQIMPIIAFVLMYKYMLDYILPALGKLFGANMPIMLVDVNYTFGALIFFGIWLGFGSALIMYVNAMTKIPDSLIEAGKMDGMNSAKEFFYIVLPLIYPTISTFLILGVAGVFANQAHAYMFFGANAPQQAYTFGYYFFTKVVGEHAAPTEAPYAAAGGIFFSLVLAPIVLLIKTLLERLGPTVEF